MASIYARGDVLWMKFKNAQGKPECQSSGYRRGQEALARELAIETERQAAIAHENSMKVTRSVATQPAKPASLVANAPRSKVVVRAEPAPVAQPIVRIGPPAARVR